MLAQTSFRLLAAFALAGAISAAAAPLGFDPTFGTAGKVMQNVTRAPSDDIAGAVAVQADGKTVMAGACRVGAIVGLDAYCVVRYDAAGNRDNSFGVAGAVVLQLGSSDAIARAVVLDGTKIVVAGSCGTATDSNFCIVRLLATGALDTSFNGSGVAITPMGAGNDEAWAVAMDGTKVLVAGQCEFSGGTKFCLARYTASGTLDPTYGTGGKVFAGFMQSANPFRDAARAIVVSGGSALVAGGCAPFFFPYACVVRFTANGVLDTTFGAAGAAYSDLGTSNGAVIANALAISGSRILVAAGCTNGANLDFCMLRVNGVDGSIDTTLNGTGYARIAIGAGDDVATGIGMAGSTTIMSGYCDAGGFKRFCLTAVTEAGGVPVAFNSGAPLVDSFGASDSTAQSLAITFGQLLTVAGSCGPNNAKDFCVTRYSVYGQRDTTLDGTGLRIDDIAVSPGSDSITSMVRQPDGKLVVLGNCYYSQNDACLARFNADGSLDTAFGQGGTIVMTFLPSEAYAGAVAVDASGRIVVAIACGNSRTPCVSRYLSTGAIDTTFGILGSSYVALPLNEYMTVYGVSILADGSIALGGACTLASGFDDFCWLKFAANGSVDFSFGTGGRAFAGITPTATAYAAFGDASGLMVAGKCNDNGVGKACIARVTASGQLDATFGFGGRVKVLMGGTASQARAITTQAGKIVVGGSCTVGGFEKSCVARLASDGSLDPTFGSGGTVTIASGATFNQIGVLLPDGSGVIAGGACGDVNTSAFDTCLARLLADGTLDAAFNDGGTYSGSLGSGASRITALVRDGSRVIAGAECLGANGSDFCLAAFALLPNNLPRAPSLTDVAAGNAQVVVAFTPPSDDGGSPILEYTATCGARTISKPAPPITVTNLANGVPVTCTVTATNANGTGPASDPSASVTPRGPSAVTLAASANPTTAGVYVTLTASVTGSAPTGIVEIRDGGVLINFCTNTVSAGVGACTVNTLAAGMHSLTAHYLGDVANFPSDSTPLSLSVIAPGTNLTVIKSGAGTGTVTSSPAGISCGPTCLAAFTPGAQVTLTAVADPGSTFVIMSPCDTLVGNQCTVTMSAAKSVTAAFSVTPSDQTLTVSTSGDGTVTSSPAGISCGATCTANFPIGTVVTLSLTPGTGSYVFSVGGCDSRIDDQCIVTMSTSRSVSAAFLTGTRPLGITKDGTGSGRVVARNGEIDCGFVCSRQVGYGNVVKLQAAADPGSRFAGWSGECTGTGACEVTMDALKLVTATFALSPPGALSVTQSATPSAVGRGKDVIYSISVTNAGAGAVSGASLVDITAADTQFIWASPGCANTAGTVTCSLGTLAGGASAARIVVVRPSMTPGLIANNLVASGTGAGANTYSSLTTAVDATPVAAPVPRYRLYSDVTKEHHFTTDQNEYNVLGTYVGTWVQEGTVGKVLDNPGSFGGVVAVPYYRLYDNSTRWHHWTTDANEYYTLGFIYSGWSMEGVDGYILPTQAPGTTQLYRLNYPALGALHHWTIDANEYATLTTPAYGWVGEGGSGFVVQ